MINHGIKIREEATALTAPVTGDCSVPVVIGTAPVNMAADPAAAVNVPILANSADEAIEALGYIADFKNYSLWRNGEQRYQRQRGRKCPECDHGQPDIRSRTGGNHDGEVGALGI